MAVLSISQAFSFVASASQASRLVAIGVAAIWITVCGVGYRLVLESRLYAYRASVAADAQTIAMRFADRLNREFEGLRRLPGAIGTLQEVRDALRTAHALPKPTGTDEARDVLRRSEPLMRLSRLLEDMNGRLRSNLLFLLDDNGTCIASADWASENSCLGGRYPDRRYFQDARDHGTGEQFAVGRATPLPAFYFAETVDGSSVPGVVVARQQSRDFELLLRPGKGLAFLVDTNGVVTLSGSPDTLLTRIPRTPAPPPSVALALYGRERLEPFPYTVVHGPTLTKASVHGVEHAVGQQEVSGSRQTLMVLLPLSRVAPITQDTGTIAALIAVIGLAVVALVERTLNYITCIRLNAAALAAANEQLSRAGEQLTRLATTDSLTGILNRRAFFERTAAEIERCVRHRHTLSLLVLDLDHFKSINDTHGHPIGDEALRTFTRSCKEQVRLTDTVGRIGGEEFAILLPETDGNGAAALAERVRAATAGLVVGTPTGALRITTSIGAASLRPGPDGQSPAALMEDLLHRADRALYAAKSGGRNRVLVAP